MLNIIDLVNDKAFYLDKFYEIADEAGSSNKLANNYKDIRETYKDYECFTLLLDDETPIAFSGFQKFSDGIGRVLSRTYYANSFKQKTIHSKWSSPENRVCGGFMIPFQLDFARKNNYSHVFISMQSNFKRQRMAEMLKNCLNEDTDADWERLEHLYNTCGDCEDKPQCWQHIIRHTINEDRQWNLKRQP